MDTTPRVLLCRKDDCPREATREYATSIHTRSRRPIEQRKRRLAVDRGASEDPYS